MTELAVRFRFYAPLLFASMQRTSDAIYPKHELTWAKAAQSDLRRLNRTTTVSCNNKANSNSVHFRSFGPDPFPSAETQLSYIGLTSSIMLCVEKLPELGW